MTLLHHASWSCLRRKMSRHHMTRQHTTKTRQAKSDEKNTQTKLDVQYKQTTRCVEMGGVCAGHVVYCSFAMLWRKHECSHGTVSCTDPCLSSKRVHEWELHNMTTRNKNNTKIGLSSDNIKQHNVGKSRVQSGVLCDSFNTTPPTPLPLHAA